MPASNSASSVNHPIGAGTVIVLLIAAAIFLVGDSQVERSVVRAARSEQESDLARFSESLHYSGLALSGPEARVSLPEVTATVAFDTSVKRALYGLRAARLDIYSLEGEPLYSTATGRQPPALSGGASDAFESARRGSFSSLFRPPSSALSDLGSDAEVLQSFVLVRDAPPDSPEAGRPLMVAALSTDVSEQINEAYNTVWLVAGVFTIGSLVILAAVHWVSVRSRSRLQAANDALTAQYAAVRESRERMISAADDTKRAIAEELHGSVQTKLFALWVRLSQAQADIEAGSGADVNEIRRITEELDRVREEDIRGLSHRLHPSIVRIGAAAALRSLCSGVSGALKVDLEVDEEAAALEPSGTSAIPENIRLGVYRIAELAIGNTVKHASASICRVSWSHNPALKQLKLVVEDDGVGFEPSVKRSAGLGTVNIQDYTDAMNGEMRLESWPGHGTRLTVTVPFSAEQARPVAQARPGLRAAAERSRAA
jgi:signal transduction histidine kinase